MVSGTSRTGSLLTVVVVGALLLWAVLPVAAGNHQSTGQGRFRVNAFAEVQVTDGSVAPLAVEPTTSDPGPRVFDNADGFTFNTRYTNTRYVLLLDASATNGQGASSMAIQGVTHQFGDWVNIRQGEGTKFVTTTAVGVYDADAAAYTAPGGATKSSQGTLVLRTYDTSSPVDGGVATTWNWLYDAGQNRYWFDATDKDFSNGNGEVDVYPISKSAANTYSFTHGTNSYGLASVGSAGANYVPTVRIGWVGDPAAAGGDSYSAYVLLDFPSGAPADSYSYTVQGTIYDTV